MLTRTAGALYRVGRCVERADDSAAVLAEVLHLLAAAGASGADQPARSLLAVLGAPAPIADRDGRLPDARALATALVWDRGTACSVASSVARARDSARGVREVLSVAMWECLNVTAALPEPGPGAGGADRRAERGRAGQHRYLALVRDRAAMFAGLADSTIARDDGWRFLLLGRALERAETGTRLLAARAAGGPGAPDRSTVLRCVGGLEVFLRASGRVSDEGAVVRFLAVERAFPRSLLHALALAEDSLAGLAAGPAAPTALRLVRRARSELECADPAGPATDLPDRLAALSRDLADIGDAVTAEYLDVGPG